MKAKKAPVMVRPGLNPETNRPWQGFEQEDWIVAEAERLRRVPHPWWEGETRYQRFLRIAVTVTFWVAIACLSASLFGIFR